MKALTENVCSEFGPSSAGLAASVGSWAVTPPSPHPEATMKSRNQELQGGRPKHDEPEIVVGLDIGTTKVTAVVGEVDDGTITILGAKGRVFKLHVKDPAVMAQVKEGDQVKGTYVVATGIVVVAPKAKK